jgi:hypothetical protein
MSSWAADFSDLPNCDRISPTIEIIIVTANSFPIKLSISKLFVSPKAALVPLATVRYSRPTAATMDATKPFQSNPNADPNPTPVKITMGSRKFATAVPRINAAG